MRRQMKFVFDLVLPQKMKTEFLKALPFWIASLLVGLIAVGYTLLFGYSERLMHYVYKANGWLAFIIAPIAILLAWVVVRRFAPEAKGSGIPQVMAAIEMSSNKNEEKVDRLLNGKIVLAKIGSSLLMVLGGAAVGREGPTIQISSSIFRMVNRSIPSDWPKLSKQSFILTGASAGLAAAFNTPLGGIIFAMEELARIHVRFFRTALFSAVIIAGLTAQGLLGPYLYLGYPKIGPINFIGVTGVVVTALLTGFGGASMSQLILKALKKKSGIKTPAQNVIFLVLIGWLIASIAQFISPAVLGSGKDLMQAVLFTDEKSVTLGTVLLRIAGPILAFVTGGAGGVFAPSLAAGAGAGAWMSGIFELSGPGANILILCGMVGFLTGVTRTPFTSAILVLEMTDRHSVIFYLMLAAMLSYFAAMTVSKHSFYDVLKKGYTNEE
ncbi:MAG TPA: chloride channel protein, partial [Flavitalea sp.]|nr:chloride channel protein [Flavitalea sp.]